MLIHKIENRLDEEKYVNKFLNQLDNNMERVQKEIDSVFAKAQKNGKWSRAEIYKYNRMKKLKQNLRQIHGKYQAKFKNDFRNVLTGLYKDEAHWMQGLLKNQKNLGIAYDELNSLPVNAVKTQVVDGIKIKGKTMAEYVSKYGNDVAFKTEQEVIGSIVLGENPKKTARRLRALNKSMKNRVEMTVRSWTNAIWNQSNLDVYKQAKIHKVRYLATFDERTCVECADYHDNTYKIGKQPLLPLHPFCRCAYSPFISTKLTPPSESGGFEGWLRDGRRSEKQLTQTKNRVQRAMNNNVITKQEGKHLIGLISQHPAM